jgi:hypothetical protein
MWFLCVLLIYCWGILGNLLGRSRMIGLRIDIRLKMMERLSHLYHYNLDKFMKVN